MFLGYWRNEAATQAKFKGDWCLTGDLATVDADGYLWYAGRADDVFKSAGYRIGPGEIESCLIGHPAVANAAVVPKPDAERGAVVKAYVVLTPEFAQRDRADLIENLQEHVRERLAPYEYPKEIEFVDELPMTTTGKIQRRILRLREEERARAMPAPASVSPASVAPASVAPASVAPASVAPASAAPASAAPASVAPASVAPASAPAAAAAAPAPTAPSLATAAEQAGAADVTPAQPAPSAPSAPSSPPGPEKPSET